MTPEARRQSMATIPAASVMLICALLFRVPQALAGEGVARWLAAFGILVVSIGLVSFAAVPYSVGGQAWIAALTGSLIGSALWVSQSTVWLANDGTRRDLLLLILSGSAVCASAAPLWRAVSVAVSEPSGRVAAVKAVFLATAVALGLALALGAFQVTIAEWIVG